jgi:hypothetical protein
MNENIENEKCALASNQHCRYFDLYKTCNYTNCNDYITAEEFVTKYKALVNSVKTLYNSINEIDLED